MKADGITPPIPPNPCPWLTDWLFEAGPTGAGAMGPVPLGWTEIADWARLTGQDLLPWEARVLRQLSADFAAEMVRAETAEAPAPWQSIEDMARNREAVARQISNTFRALAMAQARKG